MIKRIIALLLASCSFAVAQAPKPAPSKTPTVPANAVWHDVKEWGVEGRGWSKDERARWFQRLPDKAHGKVTEAVWGLSQDSSGMMVRFKTDATAIYTRYKLSKAKIEQPHMPATGVSGLDLYARNEKGEWRWVNVTKPTSQNVQAVIIEGMAPGLREYEAFLPLYNGIESLEIGVAPEAKFEGQAPRSEKGIIFYGTSITHGACASRPGMVHTAILGRRLDLPVMNLGFSGNGRMDAAMGDLLMEEDPAVYVIDCLPNMGPADVTAKCEPLVKQLRGAHPETPIVLVEDRRNTNSWITPARAKHHDDNHAALKAAYQRLLEAGVKALFYIDGDHLYGDDADGATDGSHANDLGFVRQSDIFEPVLRKALKTKK